jgi:hypothetical protein
MTSPNSETANRFYELLGRCIYAWAKVDDELFLIFRDCLGPYEQSAIIFYRTPGLDLRLNLTAEIVESVLPKPERKSGAHPHDSVKIWRKLAKEFRGLLSTRRRLAHHPVSVRADAYFSFDGSSTFGGAPFYSGQPINPRLELHTGHHEQLRDLSSNLQPLTEDDLKGHLSAVHQLAFDLSEYMKTVLIPQHEECLRKQREQARDTE